MWNVQWGTCKPSNFDGYYPDMIAYCIAMMADKCESPSALLCGAVGAEHLKITHRWRDVPVEDVNDCKLIGKFDNLYDVYLYGQWESRGFAKQILVSSSHKIEDASSMVTIQCGATGFVEYSI